MPKLEQIDSNTSFRKIEKWLHNPETPAISENDKKIYDRMKFAYDGLQRHPKKHVATSLQRVFGISHSLAYYDINNAVKLFNPINRQDKEFIKIWIIERLMTDIRIMRAKDHLTATEYKALQGLYASLIKVSGNDRKEDGDEIDPDLLGNNTLIANFVINNRNIQINFDDINSKPATKEMLMQNIDQDISFEEAKTLLENEEATDN